MASSVEEIVGAKGLKKVYRSGVNELALFDDLSFSMARGELTAIVGPSGAGKSTLLHMLGALDRPSAGSLRILGRELTTMSEDEAAAFRNCSIGYVWQFHYLLPEFTALENVAMPLLMRGGAQQEALARARQLLDEVGLSDRGHHRSGELSGGEQQRIALARALVTEPELLLADEPTGDLDRGTAEAIFTLLTGLHKRRRLTVLLVTHDLGFAARCERVLTLRGGGLVETPPSSLAQFAESR